MLTGTTPLMLAVTKSHTQIVKMLLPRKSKTDEQFLEELNSCLHTSVSQGSIVTLRALLDYCQKNLAPESTSKVLYELKQNNKTALELASCLKDER